MTAWLIPIVVSSVAACGDDGGQGPATTTTGATDSGSQGSSDATTTTTATTSGGETGSTSDADTSDGSSGDTTGGDPDLDSGNWVLENVSNTPPQSLHGAQARLDDGTTVVVWAESKVDALLDLDLMVADDSSGSWAVEPLTDDPGVQHTWPSLKADGASAYLVWNGRSSPTEDNDILFAKTDGESWTAPQNLTTDFEQGDLRRDFYPVLLPKTSAELLALYFSVPIDAELNTLGPIDMRVVRFTTDGEPTMPETAYFGTMGDGCGDFTAISDASGVIHAVVVCGSPSAGELMHVTDATGDWSIQALSPGFGQSDFGPALAVDPGGEVHLVWTTDQPCGANMCAEVYHARLTADGIDTPVVVSNAPARDDLAPTVAVDPKGRILVAWSGDEDVHVAWSEDGTQFSDPRNVTPDTPDTTDRFPQSFVFDADTGLPSLVLESVIADTQPLNVEILRAHLEP